MDLLETLSSSQTTQQNWKSAEDCAERCSLLKWPFEI
jgi:hypothetical protein